MVQLSYLRYMPTRVPSPACHQQRGGILFDPGLNEGIVGPQSLWWKLHHGIGIAEARTFATREVPGLLKAANRVRDGILVIAADASQIARAKHTYTHIVVEQFHRNLE